MWSAFGPLIGTLKEIFNPFYTRLIVKDPSNDIVLKINGPFCTRACPGRDVDFKVISVDDETEVGTITKQWSRWARETFTDADYFKISFSTGLDVRLKILLLGASLLIVNATGLLGVIINNLVLLICRIF